jgi:hypothetical protein
MSKVPQVLGGEEHLDASAGRVADGADMLSPCFPSGRRESPPNATTYPSLCGASASIRPERRSLIQRLRSGMALAVATQRWPSSIDPEHVSDEDLDIVFAR